MDWRANSEQNIVVHYFLHYETCIVGKQPKCGYALSLSGENKKLTAQENRSMTDENVVG